MDVYKWCGIDGTDYVIFTAESFLNLLISFVHLLSADVPEQNVNAGKWYKAILVSIGFRGLSAKSTVQCFC
jgi:hypothetical protein